MRKMSKKILTIFFTMLLCCSAALCGAAEQSTSFSIMDFAPENDFVEEHDYVTDMQYVDDIVAPYRDRFVVTKEEYIDCSDIDGFFKAMSTPLTLSEIDSGKYKTKYENVYLSSERKKQFNTLKVAGSFGGITAEFEPIVFYRVYRKTSIIGGYIKYRYIYEEPEVAQWLCCENMQNLTKELINNNLRITLLDKITDLINYSKNDNRLVIAVLQSGKLDSLYEREEKINELEEIDVEPDFNIELN